MPYVTEAALCSAAFIAAYTYGDAFMKRLGRMRGLAPGLRRVRAWLQRAPRP